MSMRLVNEVFVPIARTESSREAAFSFWASQPRATRAAANHPRRVRGVAHRKLFVEHVLGLARDLVAKVEVRAIALIDRPEPRQDVPLPVRGGAVSPAAEVRREDPEQLAGMLVVAPPARRAQWRGVDRRFVFLDAQQEPEVVEVVLDRHRRGRRVLGPQMALLRLPLAMPLADEGLLLGQ